MSDTVLGPIDYLAVEWPGRHVTGEGFRLLMDLVDREIVRVLDLLLIAKDADGTVWRPSPRRAAAHRGGRLPSSGRRAPHGSRKGAAGGRSD